MLRVENEIGVKFPGRRTILGCPPGFLEFTLLVQKVTRIEFRGFVCARERSIIKPKKTS